MESSQADGCRYGPIFRPTGPRGLTSSDHLVNGDGLNRVRATRARPGRRSPRDGLRRRRRSDPPGELRAILEEASMHLAKGVVALRPHLTGGLGDGDLTRITGNEALEILGK